MKLMITGLTIKLTMLTPKMTVTKNQVKKRTVGTAGVELMLVKIQMVKMRILKKIQMETKTARTVSMLLTPKKKKLAKNHAKNQTARSPGLKVILKTIQMTRMMILK